jgi:hypothetical protein
MTDKAQANIQPDLVEKRFHLPWLQQWRTDFLECSRILSRERQADEIAQRLLYRLRWWLNNTNRQLTDVKVLASITTPGMLLAAALYRWWPTEDRPAIADLGYYLMLSDPKELPVIIQSGGVIIVQDVIDTHKVSSNLISALSSQRLKPLCVLAFVRLLSEIPTTRAIPINDWEAVPPHGCPHHALIETHRPVECEPPKNVQEDALAFWIEPRSLHPHRYTTLRRELTPGRDPSLDRRDKCLKRFDSTRDGCHLVAGHYVFGSRHFPITIDIRRALGGELGDEIAQWLADVCEGKQDRMDVEWELRGKNLKGDVTAVLMPLHSQIHYVWPKVVNILAQRNRRQLNWWLEAALFTGSGQEYFLPAQFEDQLKVKVRDAINSPYPPNKAIDNPLRILILDDAIATGRTAENVITTILRKVRKAFNQIAQQLGQPERTMDNCPKPIQWIRYFSFLNQMDNARHLLWHSIHHLGKRQIPIVFEEYAPFMGVPIYDNKTCPMCKDLDRLEELRERCKRAEAEEPRRWTEARIKELRPIAVDSPDFRGAEPPLLRNPINVLSARSHVIKTREKYEFNHADAAIWRFYELMYLSYPPSDVLLSLNDATALPSEPVEKKEYERYRWVVLEWGLHHWQRVKANAAEQIFVRVAIQEVEHNSPLVERICEAASVHIDDPYVADFVADLIARLGKLERQRITGENVQVDREERTRRLEKALQLLFLNVPPDNLRTMYFGEPRADGSRADLLSFMAQEAKAISRVGHNVLRNMYLGFSRPHRYAEPTWTLETLAESIFRGRDPLKPYAGTHELLPKLIADVMGSYVDNPEKRRFLRTSLVQFLGGLEDLRHYSEWKLSKGAAKIASHSKPVLAWLALSPEDKGFTHIPNSLRHLQDDILPGSQFSIDFNELFHDEIRHIDKLLHDEVQEQRENTVRLDFEFVATAEVKKCRVLTNVHGLINCLANLTINPIADQSSHHKSRIEVRLLKDRGGSNRIAFTLLTNFKGFAETRQAIDGGPSISVERDMLEKFGATFGQVKKPSKSEKAEGFTASYEFSVMSGFIPRRLRS